MVHKLTTFFVILMLIALTQSAHAEDAALLKTLSKANTVSYMIWTVEDSKKDFIKLRCLVTKDPELGHVLKVFDLKHPKPLLEFKPSDSFVGMFPTNDARSSDYMARRQCLPFLCLLISEEQGQPDT